MSRADEWDRFGADFGRIFECDTKVTKTILEFELGCIGCGCELRPSDTQLCPTCWELLREGEIVRAVSDVG